MSALRAKQYGAPDASPSMKNLPHSCTLEFTIIPFHCSLAVKSLITNPWISSLRAWWRGKNSMRDLPADWSW